LTGLGRLKREVTVFGKTDQGIESLRFGVGIRELPAFGELIIGEIDNPRAKNVIKRTNGKSPSPFSIASLIIGTHTCTSDSSHDL